MPNRARRPMVATAAPNFTSLVAAAQIVAADKRASPQYERPQDEAWHFYYSMGELQAGVNWLGNVVSRARLVAAEVPKLPGDEPTMLTDGSAVQLVEDIGSGIGGQSELLRSAAIHLSVPGEGWFVGATEDAETSWKFYSADEIKLERGQYAVLIGDNQWRSLGLEVLPIRVFRRNERYHYRADSQVLAALPILREIDLLNRHILATAQSRLGVNGVWMIPSEATFPINPRYADAPDPFTAEFMDVAATAIKTPGSAMAALPLVVRMAAEWIDKSKRETFNTSFDDKVLALREAAIRRLAIALDLPPEILLGLGGTNHWQAWQIEESALKVVVQPLLELVSWALTRGYQRPALAEMGAANPDEFMVWYDISELTVRPDRSADAINLTDRGIIGPPATRRETGFDESDIPTSDQRREMAAWKLLNNAMTAPLGLQMLGISIDPDLLQPNSRGEVPITDIDVEQPLGPPPTRDEPPPPPGPDAALVAACDGLVYRALEKAGNRLRSQLRERSEFQPGDPGSDCPPELMHTCAGRGLCVSGAVQDQLLEQAWTRVPEMAQRFGFDGIELERALHAYTAGLLRRGEAHSWAGLESYLIGWTISARS